MSHRQVFVVLVCALCAAAVSAAAWQPAIASGMAAAVPAPRIEMRLAQAGVIAPGTYDAVGSNANGSTYRATVVLREEGGVWFASWLISNGDTFKGEGSIVDGRLVIDWGQKYPVIYEAGPDGVLHGTWDQGRGTETLRPK